jgi:hypothetical protein
MDLNDLSNLIEEARSDVDNALANIAEIHRDVTRKADVSLGAGKLNTAEACADAANRAVVITSVGQAFLRGIIDLGDRINALGLE